jgi:FAD-dependent urate hydroxylase
MLQARSRLDVAIVGAGPYGLAIAAFLRHAGMQTTVYGDPMEFWRKRMPRNMLLRSSPRASHIADPERALTLDDYAAAHGVDLPYPLPLERFLDYAAWFQSRVVPDVDPRRVRRVTVENSHFRLQLSDRTEPVYSHVVVAAGLEPFAYWPPQFAGLASNGVSHSSDHADLAPFRGRRVLVVGAGQSALESAALLREVGAEVEVLVRRGQVFWLSPLDARPKLRWPKPPTDLGGRLSSWIVAAPDVFRRLSPDRQVNVAYKCIRPAGAAWLRDRLEGVPIEAGREVRAVRPVDGQVEVTLDHGEDRRVDHVMLGTGYRIDVSRYDFMAPELVNRLELHGGYPRLRRGLESNVPGLHFVGASAALSFGPIMRFVVGTWYAAPAVTRAILSRRQPLLRLSY